MTDKIKNKKKIIISAIIAVVLIIGCISTAVYIIRTPKYIDGNYYDVPYYRSEDGEPLKMYVPDKTKFVEYYGLLVMKYESDLSVEEVNAFYEDYFNSLQRVTSKHNNVSEMYYDKDLSIVYSDFSAFSSDGKTRFIVGIDKCENLDDGEFWLFTEDK